MVPLGQVENFWILRGQVALVWFLQSQTIVTSSTYKRSLDVENVTKFAVSDGGSTTRGSSKNSDGGKNYLLNGTMPVHRNPDTAFSMVAAFKKAALNISPSLSTVIL